MGVLISYTTRPLRGTEQNGKEYFFISEEEFLALKQKGFFVEWATVYTHYYGTSAEQIQQHEKEGRIIIKDFDLQGAEQIKKLYPSAVTVFIAPPSVEELLRRVKSRRENTPQEIQIRMEQVQWEMDQSPHFDYVLKNSQLEKTVEQLKKIIDSFL